MPHCHHCEYDLTGCTGQSCPECGTAIDYYKIDRKAARRRLDRAYLTYALIGVAPLAAAAILRWSQGRFTLLHYVLAFIGLGWVLITSILWYMHAIETP
jgi:uncharacterized membrane protein YdbT with pleckstrin-like domain